MKKVLFFLVVQLFIIRLTYSQSDIKLRHLQGKKAIKVGQAFMFGADKSSMTTVIGYNQYFSGKLFFDAGLNIEYGNIEDTKLNNYYLRVNGNYTLVNLNDNIFVNAAGGIFGGLEKSHSNILKEDNELSTYCGGINIGLTTELFINNTICVEPFVYQYIQLNSSLGSAFYNLGLNLKFNF